MGGSQFGRLERKPGTLYTTKYVYKKSTTVYCMYPRRNWDSRTGGGGVPIPTTGEKAEHSTYSVLYTL